MTHLSLFTGIGGIDLAAEWAGFETVGQCEWADYPTKVLEKHWPDVPRWRDVRDVTADALQGQGIEKITVVSAGFPCQPHSLAGKRKASDDERDLWGEVVRILCEVNPRWFMGENVPGLLSSEDGQLFGRVLRELAEMGYSVGWCCFPAHATGSDLWGERVFIVAASDSVRRDCMVEKCKERLQDINLEMLERKKTESNYLPLHVEWPIPKPVSGYKRNDDGLSEGMDRLKCLGNAVVPQQIYPIFKAIAQIEEEFDGT